ncbi:phosphoglycerate mutase [Lactococcus hodotermopsidis]|uniref:Phosphoglycerate mutase n=1 Tax=Pseudolactococcus hodotermopsidis TaxID=2709157 RepID=A0A6A0BBY0_9LACT|nr:histidine phosphatase family protein [Lactococcus hodotermopsidis]GFH41894.1 phosphoglycerate mutase [Lactococcus hodotermopsidis]
MKLYFVRHGKTEWNQERRLQGMTGDSPLLAEALIEVAKLGDYLADTPFDAIFSSPSKRAVDTAMILSRHNHQPREIIKKTELFEWNLGTFEGMLIDEAHQLAPTNMTAFRHHPEQFWGNPFGAENLTEVYQRFSHFMTWLSTQDYENVLIISHGAFLSSSLKLLTGTPIGDLRPFGVGLDNNSLSIVDYDGENYVLTNWNEKHG